MISIKKLYLEELFTRYEKLHNEKPSDSIAAFFDDLTDLVDTAFSAGYNHALSECSGGGTPDTK
ncbi:MAG: hypothetical protein HFE90_09235 [Firmicutes bacterium]|nr:hypothetical protein [Bacillota bacterium]